MSDGLDDLFGTDDSGQPAGGKLRQLLEEALNKNKALETQLAEVQATQRESALDGLFAKHSIPALAKDFFPKDGALTDESATAFVEKYGQLWGAQAAAATTPPDQQAATTAAQAFAAQAGPPPAAPVSEEQYRAKFSEAQTKADFLRMLAEMESTVIVQEE